MDLEQNTIRWMRSYEVNENVNINYVEALALNTAATQLVAYVREESWEGFVAGRRNGAILVLRPDDGGHI